jgi:hypothetical protein
VICPLFRLAVISYAENVPHGYSSDPDEAIAGECEKCIQERCAWWSKSGKKCCLSVGISEKISRFQRGTLKGVPGYYDRGLCVIFHYRKGVI